MNKADFMAKIKEMLPDLNEAILKEAGKLYSCGGVDTGSFDNDYVLPKIVLTVALENQAFQYMPFHPDYKKEVKNLRKF